MTAADVRDLAAASRCYRRYHEDQPLSRADLEALVAAAALAPTGNNTQLLRFRLVAEKDLCQTVFSHLHWAAALPDWDGPAEGERPAGYVLVCLPAEMAANPVRLIDVGIASQTIALAAAAEGIGCCMHRSFDAALADDLGLSALGYVPSLVLALGRPAETVVIDVPTTEHGLTYWRDADDVHHVPKLGLEALLV